MIGFVGGGSEVSSKPVLEKAGWRHAVEWAKTTIKFVDSLFDECKPLFRVHIGVVCFYQGLNKPQCFMDTL